jgi:hypothetical protein
MTRAIHPAAVPTLKWVPCRSVSIVQWCGHAEVLLPSPWGLFPVMELADEA